MSQEGKLIRRDTNKEKLLRARLNVIIYQELRGRSSDSNEMVETFEQVVSSLLSDRNVNFEIQKINDYKQMLDSVMGLVQTQKDPCILLLYFPNQKQVKEGYIWDTLKTIHEIELSYAESRVPVLICTYNDDQSFSQQLSRRSEIVPNSLPYNLAEPRGPQLFVVDPLTEVTPSLILPRLQQLLPNQPQFGPNHIPPFIE